MSEIVEYIEEEKQWTTALNSRDCKHLMALLRQHPRLWLKPNSLDRTVLHVAVIQGCVELVKLVLRGPPKANDNREEFRENLKELLYAKDGKSRADVFMLLAIVGNQEVIQVLNAAYQPRDIDMKSTHLDPSFEVEIIDLLKELPSSELYESLQKQMKKDVDYNFEEQRKGLIFNFACKKAHSNIVFLKSMITKAKEKPNLLQKLFTQMDAQGRTPLHVAVDHCRRHELMGIQELLELMPDECVNGLDAAGRTPLLRATANGMSVEESKVVKTLADHNRTDLNAEWPGDSGATALHLAVLHGHGLSARYVLQAYRDNPKELANMEKQMSRRIKVFKLQSYLTWTPLELAAIMGRHSVLVNLLSEASGKGRKAIHDEHCLHLAAAAGDPGSIQALLLNRSNDLRHFETNSNFGGYSCLHFAVFASLPHQRFPIGKPFSLKAIDEALDRFLAFSDFASINGLQQELTMAASEGPQKFGMPIFGYRVKKTCTILLLRVGVDLWPSKNFIKAMLSKSFAKDF